MTSPNVVFNYNFELAVNSPDRNNKNTKESRCTLPINTTSTICREIKLWKHNCNKHKE